MDASLVFDAGSRGGQNLAVYLDEGASNSKELCQRGNGNHAQPCFVGSHTGDPLNEVRVHEEHDQCDEFPDEKVSKSDLRMLELKLEERFSAIIAEERTNMENRLKAGRRFEAENRLLWNVNAACVLCWKGSSGDASVKKVWNDVACRIEERATKRSLLSYFVSETMLRNVFRYLPGCLVFFEISILFGMIDQGVLSHVLRWKP